MATKPTLGVLVVVLLVAGGCAGGAPGPPPPPREPPSAPPTQRREAPTAGPTRPSSSPTPLLPTPPATSEAAARPTAVAGRPGAGDPGFFASVALGKGVYALKCSPCHGESGRADGPAAAALEVKPPAFADPEFVRSRTPASLFRTITEGKPPMPAWGSALAAEERWDVQAYEWSLSTSSATLARGRALYEAECASCHGMEGKGDGPRADALTSPLPDLTDFQRMAEQSPKALFQAVSDVAGEMPGFAESLIPDQHWAVVDYLRTFVYRTVVVSLPTPTPRAEVSFGSDVLPILLANCARCHSGDSPPNGLRLDSYGAVMAGSLYTPEVQPGRPEASPLIIFTAKGTMPPDAPPLTEGEIEILRRWIQAGARDN